MAKYGYVRVSSNSQNVARQMDAMRDAEVNERNIFVEKQSGKDFNRPVYKKMVRRLRKGDSLVIMSIDRLGRNYSEILDQWRTISKVKGVNIIVLNMPLLNTSTINDLLGRLISEIVLEVLSFCAEQERDAIRERQRAGIDAAKRRGVTFGRPKKELPEGFFKEWELYKRGEIKAAEAAKELNVSTATFYRWGRKMEECGS